MMDCSAGDKEQGSLPPLFLRPVELDGVSHCSPAAEMDMEFWIPDIAFPFYAGVFVGSALHAFLLIKTVPFRVAGRRRRLPILKKTPFSLISKAGMDCNSPGSHEGCCGLLHPACSFAVTNALCIVKRVSCRGRPGFTEGPPVRFRASRLSALFSKGRSLILKNI
jgi:hypothetical protein